MEIGLFVDGSLRSARLLAGMGWRHALSWHGLGQQVRSLQVLRPSLENACCGKVTLEPRRQIRPSPEEGALRGAGPLSQKEHPDGQTWVRASQSCSMLTQSEV